MTATTPSTPTTSVRTPGAGLDRRTGGLPATPPPPPDIRGPLARLRLRTRPARILALAAAAVVAVTALFLTTNTAIGHARDGLRVIGHQAGPRVVTTANLYFALSDMDTQLANILLNGNSTDLGFGRVQSLAVYDQDRAAADAGAIQALRLTGSDPDQQATVQELLDSLGEYEKLAARAILLDEQADHRAGAAPENVLAVHRKATDLMRLDLLPKAYNLTLDSGAIVRQTYDAERGAVLAGRWWVGLAGLAAVVLLVALQVYVTVRFRRLVNPALALATLGCLAFAITGTLLLSAEAAHLHEAKVRGFDSVLALSRARAISNAMNADESRYLLDPSRADTYGQVYLAKAQSILYVPAVDVNGYRRGVEAGLAPSGMPRKPMEGFLGVEAQHITLPGQRDVVTRVLSGFRQFQRSDAKVRSLVADGDRQGAVAVRLGKAEGASNVDFALYDLSLGSLIAVHQQTFTQAIDEGDNALDGWNIALPAAGVLVVALIVIGVRPRVAEYR